MNFAYVTFYGHLINKPCRDQGLKIKGNIAVRGQMKIVLLPALDNHREENMVMPSGSVIDCTISNELLMTVLVAFLAYANKQRFHFEIDLYIVHK